MSSIWKINKIYSSCSNSILYFLFNVTILQSKPISLLFLQWSMKPKTAFLNSAQLEWVISSTRLLHGFQWATFLATMSTIRSKWPDWMRPDNDSRQLTGSLDRKDKKSCFCKWSWIAITDLTIKFTYWILLAPLHTPCIVVVTNNCKNQALGFPEIPDFLDCLRQITFLDSLHIKRIQL